MRLFLLFLVLLAFPSSFADGLPRRGTLGVALRQVPEDQRAALKLQPQEALQVTADANGLKANDLIVAVDGHRFKTFAEYNELMRGQTDKTSANLTVTRDGKENAVEIKIVPKPADASEVYETIYDDVTSNGHRIRTFVTKPKRTGKHPVLFWIQGINASTIDFPLSAKNYISPFLKVFADAGYVIVRVEKPGVGDSEGGPARLVGYDEEVDIYRQAMKSLEKYDFVDRDNVFVFGHSMGGCTAPIVCSEIPVKGIITYGTVSNSWLEWEIRSPRIQGVLGGETRAQVDKEVRQVTQFYNYLFNEKRTLAWIKENRPELADFAAQQSSDGVMLGDRSIAYMQEVNDKNFCDYWTKLGETKVLALFGEFDWISLREDQTQVADAVNAAHPGLAEFQTVPESDHIFTKCTSMPDSFARFGKPGTEFNMAVVQATKQWTDKLSGRSSSR